MAEPDAPWMNLIDLTNDSGNTVQRVWDPMGARILGAGDLLPAMICEIDGHTFAWNLGVNIPDGYESGAREHLAERDIAITADGLQTNPHFGGRLISWLSEQDAFSKNLDRDSFDDDELSDAADGLDDTPMSAAEEDEYERLLARYERRGMTLEEADEQAMEVLEFSRDLIVQYDDITPDPDWLFRTAREDAERSAYLVETGELGVTDDDIRGWHARTLLNRMVNQAEWEMDGVAAMLHAMQVAQQSDAPPEEGFALRVMANWRNPYDEYDEDEHQATLPAELYPRYQAWFDRKNPALEEIAEWTKDLGTLNEFIRQEVRAGRI